MIYSSQIETPEAVSMEKGTEVRRQERTIGWPLYYVFGRRTEGAEAFWVEFQGPNGPARMIRQEREPEPATMFDLVFLTRHYDPLPEHYENTPFRFYDGESPEIDTASSERGSR